MNPNYEPHGSLSSDEVGIIGVAVNLAAVLQINNTAQIVNVARESGNYSEETIAVMIARERDDFSPWQQIVEKFTIEPHDYFATFDSVVGEKVVT